MHACKCVRARGKSHIWALSLKDVSRRMQNMGDNSCHVVHRQSSTGPRFMRHKKWNCFVCWNQTHDPLFYFVLLTHEGSHRPGFLSNPVMTSSAGGAKGCLDHRFRAPQPILPNCWFCNDTEPSTSRGRLSSNTQATLEQSPIQVLTKLNIAWLQWELVFPSWYATEPSWIFVK